jgi:hypothetical protein
MGMPSNIQMVWGVFLLSIMPHSAKVGGKEHLKNYLPMRRCYQKYEAEAPPLFLPDVVAKSPNQNVNWLPANLNIPCPSGSDENNLGALNPTHLLRGKCLLTVIIYFL